VASAIGPFVLLAGAIAATVAGVVYAYEHFETFRKIVNGVRDWIVANWPGVRDAVLGALEAIQAWFVANWPTIQAAFETAWNAVKTGFQWLIDHQAVLLGVLVALAAAIFGPIGALVALGGALVYAYENFDGFRNVVDSVVSWITGTAVPALQQAWQWIMDNTAAMVAYVSERWNDISTAVQNVLTYLQLVIGLALAPIIFIWQNAHDQILAIAGIVWQNIQLVVSTAIAMIKDIIDIVLGLLSGDWGRAWDGIKGLVADAWNYITGVVQLGIDLVQTIISGALAIIAGLWSLGWDTVKSALSTAWEAMKTAVSTAIGEIVKFAGELPGKVRDALGDLTTYLVEKGADLIHGFLAGITAAAGEVIHWASELPGDIVGWIGDLGHTLWSAGADLIQGLINGIKSKAADIPGIVGGILSELNPLNHLPDLNPIDYLPGHASGALITRPEVAQIGESGTEAVINGDQAVRLVWAMANGAAAGGGGGGGGIQIDEVHLHNDLDVESLGRMAGFAMAAS
jgi:phage-related protein